MCVEVCKRGFDTLGDLPDEGPEQEHGLVCGLVASQRVHDPVRRRLAADTSTIHASVLQIAVGALIFLQHALVDAWVALQGHIAGGVGTLGRPPESSGP